MIFLGRYCPCPIKKGSRKAPKCFQGLGNSWVRTAWQPACGSPCGDLPRRWPTRSGRRRPVQHKIGRASCRESVWGVAAAGWTKSRKHAAINEMHCFYDRHNLNSWFFGKVLPRSHEKKETIRPRNVCRG